MVRHDFLYMSFYEEDFKESAGTLIVTLREIEEADCWRRVWDSNSRSREAQRFFQGGLKSAINSVICGCPYCPVQRLMLSGPSGVIVCYLVWFAARLQT